MDREFDPSLTTLRKIANALDTPVSDFFDATKMPLDANTRQRIEASLQDLLKIAPTVSPSEVRAKLQDLIVELAASKSPD